MPPMPKIKANNWGKVDKKYLSNLISAGDVDITHTSYLNIKAVRLEYFKHHDIKKIRCNFRDFAATLDLKTKDTGATQCKAGKVHVFSLYFNVDC
jgi:hypothetical protein